jgi:hypothetical protein
VPLAFEKNVGQHASPVQYFARGLGYNIFLTPAETTLVRPAASPTTAPTYLRMDLVGANANAPATTLDPLPGTVNYFQGGSTPLSVSNQPTAGKVQFAGVYPGVDVEYYGSQSLLEFDFQVHPGINPSVIQLAFPGATGLSLDAQGNLLVQTATGSWRQQAPVLYQTVNGTRRAVSGQFVLQANNHVGFSTGPYDASLPLVIDPVLGMGSYLGGAAADQGLAVATDAAGNLFVTGSTASNPFPVSGGSFQTTFGGGTDAFVSKFSPSGALLWSTYYGGSGNDQGNGIYVDSASGKVFVTGSTTSPNLATSTGAFQTALNGSSAAFVIELSSSGSSLLYGTYYGGGGTALQEGKGIQVDSGGNIYITGDTGSTSLPLSANPYQGTYPGGPSKAFLAEFNPAASGSSQLVYGSYFGSNGTDVGYALTLNASNQFVVAGSTSGGTGGGLFPTTSGAYQTTYGGGPSDAFLAVLSPSTGLVYSTLLGGSGSDVAYAVANGSGGTVWVAGQTSSATYPTTSGALQTTLRGPSDAFLTQVYPTPNTPLPASTLFGGSGDDRANGIALTSGGLPTIVGTTTSADLPTSPAWQSPAPGGGDAFVAQLTANATGLNSGFYVGGSASDQGNAIALDSAGTIYLAGTTASTDLPTFSSYQSANNGGTDVFVQRLPAPPPALWPPQAVGDLISTAAGASGNAPGGFSEGGVRYADGLVRLADSDLSSAGFGTPWGQTRTWSNGPGYALGSTLGSGWVASQLPVLLQVNGGSSLAVVSDAATARYFDLVGSTYQPRFDEQDVLTRNTTAHEFILTDTLGDQIRFNDFTGMPANAGGRFKSYTDPAGNVTSVVLWDNGGRPLEVQRSSTVGSTTVVESYLYSYIATGVNAGLMQSAVLRRQVNGGAWSTVRQVAYAYFDGTQSYGNAGDLQTAQVKDGAGNVLDTKYYRYYTGESGGYVHGLKYAFGPAAYARLAAAVANPLTATDTQVAPYADVYLTYDSQRRVSTETVAGAGASAANGDNGLGTYSFSYTASSNAAGFNSWAVKTTETLPDNNQNIVYTNAYGEIMLQVFASGGQNWENFSKFDGQGRQILFAHPAAVTGYNDSYADLLNNQGGSYQYLNSTGLIEITDYYAPTTTSAPAGVSATLAAGGTLTVGTTYSYVVTALTAGGESIPSSEVSVTPTAGNQTAALGWNAVTGATGYNVYRGTATGEENTFLTTATATSYNDAGGAGSWQAPPVAGYYQDTKIERGQGGTPIPQRTVQYFTHAGGGATVHPVGTEIAYRNTDGTGAQITSQSYIWFSGTDQVQSQTTTLPVIASGQNGPGMADSETTFFDTLGQVSH